MKRSSISTAMLVVSLLLAPALLAQSPDSANQSAVSPAASAAEVPRLIKFSGTLLDAQDRPMAGPVGVTFALHAQQTGGAALWLETQNVTPDAHGFYTVLLGANSTNGVPAELFASGEARWLEVQVERQAEQPRILLVSVPYALKAKDAETLGGRPASAFLTTETLAGAGNSAGPAAAPISSIALPNTKMQTTSKTAAQPAVACTSVTSNGTAAANSIAMFTAPCVVQSSVITESGANVGIGTAAPAVALDIVGTNAGMRLSGTGTHQVTVTGLSSGRLGEDSTGFFFSSDTAGKVVKFLTNNGALNEWMRITSAGNVGVGTIAPLAKFHVAGGNGGQAVLIEGSQPFLTLNTSATFQSGIQFNAGGTPKWSIFTDTGGNSVNNLSFFDGATDKTRLFIDATGKVGIGTITPSQLLSFGGQSPASLGMDPNPTAGAAGNDLTLTAGSAATGATDQRGGDLILAAGGGTGNGASGNARIQTAGASGTSGTTADTLSDRVIVVGKAKAMTLSSPGFTALFSIHLTGTETAGGRVRYMVRATDGGSQIATEEGVIQYLATSNSVTCTVQTNDKLHLGTVNSGCTPGFFNPGSQPGISIFDNVSFASPAPIVVNEVYFTIENESGASIRLEP